MEHKGKLIVISGPSGVGKGTIRSNLFAINELNLAYSVSMTTRQKRVGEVEGIDYYFVTDEQFEKAIKEDKFLEWAKFVQHYYGTLSEYVDKLLDQGKNVVLEIEVVGAKEVLTKRKDALSIFILPPSLDELERRIRARSSESEDVLLLRLQKAKAEINQHVNYMYSVTNDDLTRVTKELTDIIKKHIKE